MIIPYIMESHKIHVPNHQSVYLYIIEGSFEVKLSDNMDRWKAESGKRQREEKD